MDGFADFGPFWQALVMPMNAAGDRVYVVDTGGVESQSHQLWVHDAAGRALGPRGVRVDLGWIGGRSVRKIGIDGPRDGS